LYAFAPPRFRSVAELKELLNARLTEEQDRLSGTLSSQRLQSVLEENYLRFSELVRLDADDWKKEVPGRPILATFAAAASIDVARLKRMYIDEALKGERAVFHEIFDIFDSFA